MLIGVPKEIKDSEYRVGLVPSTVRELTLRGHRVLMQKDAGVGAGLSDDAYVAAGAEIAGDADRVFAEAELIVKVKEPLAAERAKLRRGQVLFTYLHLAADREQAEGLLASGVIAIAYETVTSPQGGLPLLVPMSEVAGRMAPQAGAHCLEKENGGRGVLLGGVPGVPAADVLVLGGGSVGTNAARIAAGMGADVTVVDRSPDALRRIDNAFGGAVRTVFSTRDAVETLCRRADLVIGTVLIPGAKAPKLITAETVRAMKPGSVHRRRFHRPGRLRGDIAADHPFPSDLHRRRCRALLRRQHAGRGRAHLDLRAQQHDLAVRPRAGRQRLSRRARPGSASARGAQRLRRRHHLPRGRRRAEAALRAGRAGVADVSPFSKGDCRLVAAISIRRAGHLNTVTSPEWDGVNASFDPDVAGAEITLMLDNWMATFIAVYAIALGGVAVAGPESPAASSELGVPRLF